MSEPLLASTFLFRFAVPCHYRETLWTPVGTRLPAENVLPCFGELEGKQLFADLRVAWNETGLVFDLLVVNKTKTVWCRPNRLLDSDGLQVLIDTRNEHDVHRATRFCHYFFFLPQGGGRSSTDPLATLQPIQRAKEHPKSITDKQLRIESEIRPNGYALRCLIPADALTGFDPDEHPRLGFSYAVVDRELGWQTFTVGPEFPFREDPSLWGTLELLRP